MSAMVSREPVGVNCGRKQVVGGIAPAPGGGHCAGVMWRVSLSRMEEGLGHEGFECDKCHRRVKYIPHAAPAHATDHFLGGL